MAQTTPSRPVLLNNTNVSLDGTLNAFFISGKRSSEAADSEEPRKRVRLSTAEHANGSDSDATDSDVEMENFEPVELPKTSLFSMIHNMHRTRTTAFFKLPTIPTRPILLSFVSAHKADTYKCDSTRSDSHLALPYACAYSHAAKRGGNPLLGMATEEGAVHIVDTSKRRDWDYEIQRTTLQPHANGIFDIKWHHSDDLIATTSGDMTTGITSISAKASIASLCGHSSTVKCAQWDPQHNDVLCTGGRDGNIIVWDLRVSENHQMDVGGNEEKRKTLSPVIVIPRAHEDNRSKPGRKGKNLARSVTSLTYPEGKPFSLISSGSFDGILREWDIRFPTRKTKSPRKQPRPVLTSPLDPTILSEDARRARGITNVTAGFGPTQGLLFALGNDSHIRTYHTHTLDPLPRSTFSHPNMQTNSFYVKSSLSPCGKWLATGSSSEGRAFLYDVSNAGNSVQVEGMTAGVELKGHIGEVGAVDWALNTLATCADDGTVRVWRPDIEVHNKCIQDPAEEKWNWSWANDH